jgi:hypothetical protein
MTPEDPTKQPEVLSEDEFNELCEDLLQLIEEHEQQEKLEATADDYFDPSVWEQK